MVHENSDQIHVYGYLLMKQDVVTSGNEVEANPWTRG